MAPRSDDGTFESEYTDAHLAETVIATIARHAYTSGRASSPREVTKRQFNDARAGAGHPDCPTAQAILLRIPMGWSDLLDLALSDRSVEHTAAAVAAAKRAADPQPPITEHHAVARLVDAHAVLVREQVEDGIPAAQAAEVVVTATDFIRIGEEFRHRWARRSQHRRALHWPTIGQLMRLGGIRHLLATAGLPHEPQSGRRAPASLPLLEAMRLCVHHHPGFVPTQIELRAFMSAHGLALERGRGQHAGVGEQVRIEAGIPEHKAYGPRPDYTVVVADLAGPESRRFAGRRGKVLCLVEFLAWLPDGEEPTLRGLERFCASRPDLPAAERFEQGDDRLARLLPLARAVMDDPAVLDGDLTLPGDRAQTMASNPLARSLSSKARDAYLEVLALVADHEPLSSDDVAAQFDVDRDNDAWRHLATLSRAGALERTVHSSPGGTRHTYRMTLKGREALDQHLPDREPTVLREPKRPLALRPFSRAEQLLMALGDLGGGGSALSVSTRVGFSRVNATNTLVKLIRQGMVVRDRDPEGRNGSYRYDLLSPGWLEYERLNEIRDQQETDAA